MDLFDEKLEENLKSDSPLAYRMRPKDLSEFLGQEDIIGEGKLLRRAIFDDKIGSIILWGPPGSGKTTLARIISNITKTYFDPISAVSSGVGELRKCIKEAEERRKFYNIKTIVFIDEIHRFNKAQQDVLLPYVENGIINLIGATTENPSFEVNSALISRCRVYRLKALTDDNIKHLIIRALNDKERGIAFYNISLTDEALLYLVNMSNGDARVALNALELVCGKEKTTIDINDISDALQKRFTLYDKNGDNHYDFISALHKSMRNSDPDASLYWLARMLDAGEDPLYIARRIIRFASEDIGMADPQALLQAMASQQAVHFIGMPEADCALAQAVIYMATAPKSNSIYKAVLKIKADIANTRNEPVPLHLRNPVTKLMKNFDYGKGYKYAHDFEDNITNMQCLPDNLKKIRYYFPNSNDKGFKS